MPHDCSGLMRAICTAAVLCLLCTGPVSGSIDMCTSSDSASQGECTYGGCSHASSGRCTVCSKGLMETNWLTFRGSQYKLMTGVKAWGDAVEDCKAQGATLASFDTEEEFEWVARHAQDAWIGHFQPTGGGDTCNIQASQTCVAPNVCTCVAPFISTFTAYESPSGYRNCLYVDEDVPQKKYYFGGDACTATREFICKRAATFADWTPLGVHGVAVKSFGDLGTGSACAHAICVEEGGFVASVESDAKYVAIKSVIGTSPFFLGAGVLPHQTKGGLPVWLWDSGAGFIPTTHTAPGPWSTASSEGVLVERAVWTGSQVKAQAAPAAGTKLLCQRTDALPAPVSGECSQLVGVAAAELLLHLSFDYGALPTLLTNPDGQWASVEVHADTGAAIAPSDSDTRDALVIGNAPYAAVQLPSNGKYGEYPTQHFTVCFRIKFNDDSASGPIFSMNFNEEGPDNARSGYSFFFSGDKIMFEGYGLENGEFKRWTQDLSNVGNKQWRHVCMVHATNDKLLFYVDGSKKRDITNVDSLSLRGNGYGRGLALVGRDLHSSSDFSQGKNFQMDELVIFTVPLTKAQTASAMDCGLDTPAPPTPSPPTPAPPTPSPPTPFPATPVPPTPSPPTPSPPTPSPPTPSPATPAPPTPAPATPFPATSSPPTPAPPTPSPPTASPPTPAPPTPSPATFAPPTPAPPTPSPATSSPPTPAPPTPSPPTPSPPTPSPPTLLPPTASPPTLAPTHSPTASPPTPHPATTAPPTSSPPTPAPPTPSPPSPFPATPAPPTPSPPTLSPATPFPHTVAPPTPSPPTPSPPTSSPPTLSPATPAPLTPSPPTVSPATPFPPTAAPPTPSPLTPSPQTPAPLTPSPPTASPPTPAPEILTPSPSTPAPGTLPPLTATRAPQTAPPVTQQPSAVPGAPAVVSLAPGWPAGTSSKEVQDGRGVIMLHLQNGEWGDPALLRISTTGEGPADIFLKTSQPQLRHGFRRHAQEGGYVTLEVKGPHLAITLAASDSYNAAVEEVLEVAVSKTAFNISSPYQPIPVMYTVAAAPRALDEETMENLQTAASVTLLGAPMNIGRTNVLLKSIDCPMDLGASQMSWAENPLGLHLTAYDSPDHAGAVLGNLIFMAAVLVLHFIIPWLWRATHGGSQEAILSAMSRARFPSFSFLPAMMFYQATIVSGVHVTWTEPDMAKKLLPIGALLIYGVGLFVGVYRVLRPTLFSVEFKVKPTPSSLKGKIVRVFGGKGRYQSPGQSWFVWMFGMIFRDYYPRDFRFMLMEIAFSGLVGVINGVEVSTRRTCCIQNILNLLSYLLYLAVLVWRRPYHAFANNALSIGGAAMQALALFCALLHIIGSDVTSTASHVAVWFVYASLAFTVPKSLLDLGGVLYDIPDREWDRAQASRKHKARGPHISDNLSEAEMEVLEASNPALLDEPLIKIPASEGMASPATSVDGDGAGTPERGNSPAPLFPSRMSNASDPAFNISQELQSLQVRRRSAPSPSRSASSPVPAPVPLPQVQSLRRGLVWNESSPPTSSRCPRARTSSSLNDEGRAGRRSSSRGVAGLVGKEVLT